MSQQTINVGAAPNDNQGDPLRIAFIKCNDNFSELYARAQTDPPPSLTGSVGDFAGMYAYDSNFFYYCYADYDGSSIIWAQVSQIGNVAVSVIASGNSSIGLADINGNANITIANVSNVAVFSTAGMSTFGNVIANNMISNNIVGQLTTGSQPNITEIGALTNLTVNGTLIAANLVSNSTFSAFGNVAGGGLVTTGNVSATGNVIANNVNALLKLTAGSDISATGGITALGNVTTAGYFIGNFAGNVTGNFTVPGSDTQVLFNQAGNAQALAGFTFDPNGPNLVTVLGNISATGNVITGNLSVLNAAVFTGNVTGGNLLTAGIVSATGNVIGGNVNTAGLISATGNVTGGNLRTGGVVSATGNITGANIIAGANVLVSGRISAAGNISGAYYFVDNDINVSGNVATGRVTATSMTATGNVVGGNVLSSGQISTSGNVTGNNIIGTLATASQPNVTALGTLSSLSVGGLATITTLDVTGNATMNNLYVSGTTTIAGNIQQISGNSGQFFGNATTGFNALYAGLPAGYSLLPQSVVNYVSNFNSYTQINNQNQNGGDQATTDYVLTAGNGNDTTHFLDIGIASSGYDGTIAVANNALGTSVYPNDSYIYAIGNVTAGTGGNLVIGVPDGGDRQIRFINNGSNLAQTVVTINPQDNAANTSTGTMRVLGGIATTGSSFFQGTLTLNSGNATTAMINGGGNGVGNIGSSSKYFNTAFVKATSAQYADLAEHYLADNTYAPGTVLSFGGSQEVTASAIDMDPAVAGVVSTNPAYEMNAGLQGEHTVCVALVGRVPCRVRGPIRAGDMLVSAGDGTARAESKPAMGAVIGKAIKSFTGETGLVEIVVGRL